MAYELEVENVKEYYANLLILQYRNKQKARDTIKLGAGIYLGDGLLFELNDILNIDTAQGAQLDLIGKILGCPRNIYGFNPDVNYFSFEKTDAYGYSDKDELSEGYWKNYFNSTGSAYALSDSNYRQLLKFKALYNLMQGSMADMDLVLYIAFGNDIEIVNNKDLTITYKINNLTTAINAAYALGYLKAPMGITALVPDLD